MASQRVCWNNNPSDDGVEAQSGGFGNARRMGSRISGYK
jgi:hypothetical protein